VESVSFGDQGHRLALTIRLEPALHQRLLAARNRLGRTGQDILMASIDAYLTA
jgi:predicted DNA-binding protein